MKSMWIVLWAALLVSGCGGGGSGTNAPTGDKGGGSAAPAMDRSAEATVTVTAKPAKPKVGEEVSLTAVLSHIPAGMKYYEMSMGFTWSNEPKRSMAKSVRPKDDRILNTGELTWDAPGTYTVTATYYNGTKAFVKGTLELTVE